jgi:hypothetical protein
MQQCVSAVVQFNAGEVGNIAQVQAVALRVAFDGIMGRRDAVKLDSSHRNTLPGVDRNKPGFDTSESFENKSYIGAGNQELGARIMLQEREQGFLIEVVGMIVTAGYTVDTLKALRWNDALCQPDMRFVRIGIFSS